MDIVSVQVFRELQKEVRGEITNQGKIDRQLLRLSDKHLDVFP